MSSSPRAVALFDIDGTLIWSHGAGRGAIEAALKEQFGEQSSVEGVPFHGRTDRAILKDAFAISGIEDSQENRLRVLNAYIGNLPRFMESRPGKVLAGVEKLLLELPGRNVAVGLLTGNIRRGAKVKLEKYGLYGHFEFGGFGDDHINRNDVATEALCEVERRFEGGVDPENIWVLGDTPNDIRCARHIGVRVIAVATGGAKRDELAAENPDVVFDDFNDTNAVMQAMGL